ncbi:class I SAM-dependent methyltransferase [Desulfoplanes formicivorans]|uniref:Methyltransferase type 12 n=1 Tax=Desulfoplanes formicivorans TaxID=1592317 RepID=A0A194AIF7_9BACT|nr:class I SAM-dependent methyltransferase [Desulfoplanes formicivorans]GAU09867.1 methyltransferase type 12 [Desulfoplanes formicivorans]
MAERSEEKQQDFARKMTDILNYGALNLAMGIGYTTGLFEVLDAMDTPATVQEIAKDARLDERYIREWLGVMVTGGIVELEKNERGEDMYLLPREHGALITRRAGNDNLGVYTREIPLLTRCALDEVISGFATGQGVTYDHYPQFQAFMGQLADAKHCHVLVDTFLPWVAHGEMVRRMRQGIRVCDLGCAQGLALILMAEAFPRSSFVGFDISRQAIEVARQAAASRGLTNVSFQVRDCALLAGEDDLRETFDYVLAFDAIHDQTRPRQALQGAYALLTPGGMFSMVDIAASSRLEANQDHSMGPFLYTVSLMHCMPVGLVDGGEGLGMMWGREKAEAMLREAGFDRVEVAEIPNDPFNLHFLCIKSHSNGS